MFEFLLPIAADTARKVLIPIVAEGITGCAAAACKCLTDYGNYRSNRYSIKDSFDKSVSNTVHYYADEINTKTVTEEPVETKLRPAIYFDYDD